LKAIAPPAEEQQMEMPKPAPAHRRLEKLLGIWAGQEQMSPSPWDPQGGSAEARIENRLSCGGFAVVQDYQQIRDGAVTFEGHGVFTWDAVAERYVLHWWDSMGSPINVFVGDFEGDVLRMEYESSQGGHHRLTCNLSQEDAYEIRMELSDDGVTWKTFMVGTNVRQA